MAVFSQVSWQGGIANDEYLADSTQFSDCEDVNIYESSGYFKLGPKRTTTNLTDGQNYLCAGVGKTAGGTPIVYIAGTYSAGTEGIIAEAGSPASYIVTTGNKRPITAVGVVGQSLGLSTGTGFIITTRGGLYTWSYDATMSIGNFTDGGLTNKKANATYETKFTPYVLLGNFLYYGYLSEVRCFDTTTWVEVFEAGSGSANILDIDSSYTITNIIRQGTQFIIYANDGTNSKKYFWDGVSSEISDFIDFPNKKILNIANFGNYEIILYKTTNQYSLGIIEGYDMKPIYSSDYPVNTSKRGFQDIVSKSLYALSVGDNFMTFPKDSSYLYTLGNFKPGKGMALSKLSHDSSGDIGLIQGDGYITGTYSNVSSTSGFKTTYSTSDYDSNGFIITNPVKGTSYAIEKKCKKVMYGYKLETGSTIKIYYQINKNDDEQGSVNWTLADTITTGSDFSGAGYRSFNLNGTFNQIRFKIQLETSNSSYSPKVFDFHFEYDETNTEL